MEIVAGISFVGLIMISTLIGARMLRLAARTRQAPELFLGLSLILVMCVAYPGMIALESGLSIGIDADRVAMILMNIAIDAGFTAFFVFTWRVFRPDELWAVLLIALAMTFFSLHVVLIHQTLWAHSDLAASRPVATQLGLIPLCTASVGYAWSSFESLRHWRLMRKRERLGLADPVLTNRMLLWSLMSFSTLAGALANAIYLQLGIDVLTRPDAMFITSLTGVSQAIFLWLAFLPPTAWLERVRARAPEPI